MTVDELKRKMNLTNNKNIRAEHNCHSRIFPFYTRNPDRVKFLDDFNEIVGMVVRESIGLDSAIEINNEKIYQYLSMNIENQLDESTLKNIFNVDFGNLQDPYLFKYYPVLNFTKTQKDELRGKKALTTYIVKLLKLNINDEWKNFFVNIKHNNLYEEIIRSSFEDNIENHEIKNKDEFYIFPEIIDIDIFNRDLKVLMSDKNFFVDNISLLISYYLFYYIIQLTYRLLQNDFSKPFDMYFSYDKEKISSSRLCIKKGYKIINELSNNLLVDNDLVDYLNILSENDTFRSFDEMIHDKNNLHILGKNIIDFNYLFYKSLEAELSDPIIIEKLKYDNVQNLETQITQLRSYIKTNIDHATETRYRKSFDEFVSLTFIKHRGRLGYTFNATQELILLFTSVIVPAKDKTLLKDLFREFEKRGIKFDNQTKKEIVKFYESINILEKLSDSGDAQYVKSIL